MTDIEIQSLLPDYIRGTLPEADGRQVDAWICESPDHRRVAERYGRAVLLQDRLGVLDTVDVESALQATHARTSSATK